MGVGRASPLSSNSICSFIYMDMSQLWPILPKKLVNCSNINRLHVFRHRAFSLSIYISIEPNLVQLCVKFC